MLAPLLHDAEGRYQRYDWTADRLAEWRSVEVGGIVIVEGVYALGTELRDAYDFTIWVDCPKEVRLARGLARDGLDARSRWLDAWIPAEERYVAAQRPADFADLVVDGSGQVEHDPETQYVRLLL